MQQKEGRGGWSLKAGFPSRATAAGGGEGWGGRRHTPTLGPLGAGEGPGTCTGCWSFIRELICPWEFPIPCPQRTGQPPDFLSPSPCRRAPAQGQSTPALLTGYLIIQEHSLAAGAGSPPRPVRSPVGRCPPLPLTRAPGAPVCRPSRVPVFRGPAEGPAPLKPQRGAAWRPGLARIPPFSPLT